MNSSFLGCSAAGSLSPLPFLGCHPSAIVHVSYICHLGASPACGTADLLALQQHPAGYNASPHKRTATAKHNKDTCRWFVQCWESCATHTKKNKSLAVFARCQAATQQPTITTVQCFPWLHGDPRAAMSIQGLLVLAVRCCNLTSPNVITPSPAGALCIAGCMLPVATQTAALYQ